MEEKNKIDAIDQFLIEQQTLTAVERFSEMHEKGKIPQQEKYYKALLPGAPPGPGQQYAFQVDLDSCSGCKACITGCHNRNGLDEGEMWRNVGLIHGEKKFAPVLPLKATEVLLGDFVSDVEEAKQYHPPTECSSDPRSKKNPAPSKFYFQQHITTACHHCLDPACLTGCPVKAYEKDPQTGIVRHLDDQCIGCKYCIYKCSYGVPQYSEARGIVRKCDMCTERLREGEAPACVQSCPNQAIRITVVDTAQVAMNPGKDFQIPFSPDPHYTQPTTIYKTSHPIPDTVLPADHGVILPQPPEHSLVFMLILTQASAGIYFISSLLGLGAEKFIRVQSLMGILFGALGLGIATFHLGRPLYAYRSFLGFRTSWLSREAVFLGIFMNLAFVTALFAWGDSFQSWIPLGLKPLFMAASQYGVQEMWATAILGWVGVFSSGMIYFDTPRAGWNSLATPVKFFLTAGILGVSELIFMRFWLLDPRGETLKLVLLALILIKASIEAWAFLPLANPKDSPLKRSAILMMGELKTATILRWIAMMGGTLCLWMSSFHYGQWKLAGMGFLLLIAGECLERHLFFRAVVPPRMPGFIVHHEE